MAGYTATSSAGAVPSSGMTGSTSAPAATKTSGAGETVVVCGVTWLALICAVLNLAVGSAP